MGREEISNQDFLGIVKKCQNNKVLIEERNLFKVGDIVEFFGPGMEVFSYKIEKIFDEENQEIDVARHPGMLVYLPVLKDVPENAMMRLKVFDKKDYL